ncbi:MAG: hypothetical protein ACRD5F_07780 [Candidatus Acidiferrales bacterium]
MKLAALQAAVAQRFPSVLPQQACAEPEIISSGVAAVDALASGLPRGSLVEICGARCSGRTSLLLAVLAAAHRRGEVTALVDARDSFDPHSAQAAGVLLHRLLWARCKNIEQAFRAAEWLLTGGGFGVVALDLGEIAPQAVHRVPLNMWFRFRRAVEHTPTVLVVLEQQPHASTCASLVLELRAEGSRWPSATTAGAVDSGRPRANLFSGSCSGGSPKLRPGTAESRANGTASPLHANVFAEKEVRAAVVRSRYGNFVKQPYRAAQPDRAADSCCASFAVTLD